MMLLRLPRCSLFSVALTFAHCLLEWGDELHSQMDGDASQLHLQPAMEAFRGRLSSAGCNRWVGCNFHKKHYNTVHTIALVRWCLQSLSSSSSTGEENGRRTEAWHTLLLLCCASGQHAQAWRALCCCEPPGLCLGELAQGLAQCSDCETALEFTLEEAIQHGQYSLPMQLLPSLRLVPTCPLLLPVQAIPSAVLMKIRPWRTRGPQPPAPCARWLVSAWQPIVVLLIRMKWSLRSG